MDAPKNVINAVAARLGLMGPEKDAIVLAVQRPEYRPLTQVPFTLTLLVKALASGGVSECVLSISSVYESAFQRLLHYDLRKCAGVMNAETEGSFCESFGVILFSMAFWNHLSGAIGQPWLNWGV